MSTADTQALSVVESRQLAARDGEWSVSQIIDQTRKIQECMKAVMKPDEHYGVIPGTKKPSLWKPGAEKLCLMFRFDPEYEILAKEETAAFISFTVRCVLNHIPTGARIASGLGSCNSREEKYRRPAPKLCPSCTKPAIIKGKEEYGGGWVCFKKKEGCGAKFKDGDQSIEGQSSGLADPSDLHNTILKMGCKRALIAAVLNGTAASDCFAQDLEDLPPQFLDVKPETAAPAPAQKRTAAPAKRGIRITDENDNVIDVDPREMDSDGFERAQAAEIREEGALAEKLEASVMVDVIEPKTGEVIGREPKANRQQIAYAHVLKSDLQITDDIWRKRLLARTGYDSSGKLCSRVLSKLIDEMAGKLRERQQRAREALDEVGNAVADIPTADEIEEENRRAAAPLPGEVP